MHTNESLLCNEGSLRFVLLNPLAVCLLFRTYHIQNIENSKNRDESRWPILGMNIFFNVPSLFTSQLQLVIAWLSIVFMSNSSTVAGINSQFNGNVITIHRFIASYTSFGNLFQSFFRFPSIFFIGFIISIVLLIKCAFFFFSKSVYSSNNNSIFCWAEIHHHQQICRSMRATVWMKPEITTREWRQKSLYFII